MRRLIRIAVVVLLFAAAYWLVMSYTASEGFVRADRDALNAVTGYAYPPATAPAICAKMSAYSHVDGLLDGNFVIPMLFGGSYYYKSYCYQEVAIRSLNAAICDKVARRWTPLGHDAGVAAASCRQRVAQAIKAKADRDKTALAHAAAVAGAAKIEETEVKRAGPGSWLVSVLTRGARAGEYELAITAARRDFRETDTLGLIYRETAFLGAGENRLLWTITREQLFQALDKDSRPGGIHSVSVSLTYLKPADAQFPFERVDTSVGNAYVEDR